MSLQPIDVAGAAPRTRAASVPSKLSLGPVSGSFQRRIWLAILLPAVASAVAFALLWVRPIQPLEVGLLVGMALLSQVGIEVGFHRLLSHRAFSATKPIKILLTVLGSMALQGPPIYWVATHRRHHRFSDRPGDIHSPHLHSPGRWSTLRGLWHAHLGWVLRMELTNTAVLTKDLMRDPLMVRLNRHYVWWLALGLVFPAALGGAVTGTWSGAFFCFLWGGPVRIFLVQHLTYAVNSLGHSIGSRAYDTTERSTNNFWLAPFTLGGAWHNNHHAFPGSAATGLRWWQLDPGYWVIWALQKMGLVSQVKVPSRDALRARWAASQTIDSASENTENMEMD